MSYRSRSTALHLNLLDDPATTHQIMEWITSTT
jgi:hypothetical protein